MNRTLLHKTGRPRRSMTGLALIAGALAALVMVATTSSATEGRAGQLMFPNSAGVLGVLTTTPPVDGQNPFFQDLGANGRTCATCHRPAQGWTVTPVELRERFDRTGGTDPIFRTNDGSTCEGADVSTPGKARQAFSLLLTKGLIRVALDVPPGAEFDIIEVDDPYGCGAPRSSPSMYRRPLPSTNLKFVSAVMWDGRESVPGHSIRDALLSQAHDAVVGHAQGNPPSPAQLEDIVNFELGAFAAQVEGRSVGRLDAGGARGGARTLVSEPFCIGINDPLDMLPSMPGACASSSGGLDPSVFTLFSRWMDDESPQRRAIARGEAIFNTRQFAIDDVAGLNGKPNDPIQHPLQNGTCSVCHDTPAAGSHSVPMALNIGVADAVHRTPDLPLYTLRRLATGEFVQTTDPGRAMVTGKWNDIGKFKGPVLRGLAARGPYFHNGSAATLADVIEFYDTRFNAQFTAEEKADLLAFLQSL